MEFVTDRAWLNTIKTAYEQMPLQPAFFWTFTFEREPKQARARHYVRRYFQLLAKISGTDVVCLASLGGMGSKKTRTHSHGVMFVKDINKIKKDFVWSHGLAEWDDYDSDKGAIIYSIYGGRNKHEHYPFQINACCADVAGVSQLTSEIDRALLREQQRCFSV
jgi:hypothetical protein